MYESKKLVELTACLRLSITYRRTLLNEQLRKWQGQIRGIVLDVGGEKHSSVRFTVPSDADARKWLYLNNDVAVDPDILADGAHMPIATEAIDTVICLETLEHVADPVRVMCEISRVLRPAGVLLLSVPFLYRVHSLPTDFWRFTEYQVQRLAQNAGLKVIRLERLGLLFTVLCDMIKQAISEIRWPVLRWLLGLLFLPPATLLVSLERFDIIQRSTVISSFSTGYLVLATKG